MLGLRYNAALAVVFFTTSIITQDCPTGYSRSIDWKPCPSPTKVENGEYYIGSKLLQCGVLEVPLDWQSTDTDSMKIPLVRIPASSTALNQSIIVNPGGPGVSGIDMVAFSGDYLQKVYGTGYDVIGFDPRGVGLSKPFDGTNYDCPDAPNKYLGPYESSAQISASYEYNIAQAEACAKAPYLVKSQLVGSAYVARDIVAIAQALGQDGYVRYYGYSYGTLLGATLATMFPSRMERVVLDGNINPYDYYFGNGDEAVADVDRAVSHFFEECSLAGPPKCNLSTALGKPSGSELENQFANYLEILYDRDVGEWYQAKIDIWEQMKTPYGWNDYADSLSRDKDWKAAGASTIQSRKYLQKRQTQVTASDVGQASKLTSLQDQALNAITCGDYQGKKFATINEFSNVIDIWSNRSYYGGDILVMLQLQCIVWDTDAREQYPGPYSSTASQVQTKNPVLIVNGRFDPLTPLISAQGSAKGFANAVVLKSNGTGHCVDAHVSSELTAVITEYFATGEVPVGAEADKIYEPDEGPFDVFYVPPAGATREAILPRPGGSTLTSRRIPVLEEMMREKRKSRRVGRSMASWSVPIGCKPST